MKPELALAALPARVVHTRTLALACLLALIALCLAWELWLAPTGRGTLALKALPLALAVPGLLNWRMYTFRWLSLVLWLYVAEGAVRATSDRGLGAPLALLEVLLCLVLFGACAAHIRWRLTAAKANAA
ncbi:MAG: DUF2069 domain-containing protein [Burkholderiales bacterium]|nr:DUF2069 domain-containing protein [Burkholderiales bacterium]